MIDEFMLKSQLNPRGYGGHSGPNLIAAETVIQTGVRYRHYSANSFKGRITFVGYVSLLSMLRKLVLGIILT